MTQSDFVPMDRELELTLLTILWTACVWGRNCPDLAVGQDTATMLNELHNVPGWLALRDASREAEFQSYLDRLDRPWAQMLRERQVREDWRSQYL